MQCRDVAEAYDEFRILPDEIILQQRQSALRAEAAARGKYCAYMLVLKHFVKIVGALLIASGKVASSFVDILPEMDPVAKPFQIGYSFIESVGRGKGPGRCADAYNIAAPEAFWFDNSHRCEDTEIQIEYQRFYADATHPGGWHP